MFEYHVHYGELLSGESGWWDFFVQCVASFIGVLGAYGIFRLQRKADIKKTEDLKDAFEKDKIRYLNHLISRNIDYTRHLIKGIIEFKNNILEDPITLTNIKADTEDDLIRVVSKINHEEFYHAYRIQVKGNEIIDVFHSTDIIYGIKNSLIPELDTIKKISDHGRKHEYSILVNELYQYIFQQMRKIEHEDTADKKPPAYLSYIKWHKYFGNLKEYSFSDLKYVHENFVLKVFNEFSKDIPIRFEIEFELKLMRAIIKYNEITPNNLHLVENLNFDLKQLLKAYKVLVTRSRKMRDIVATDFKSN